MQTVDFLKALLIPTPLQAILSFAFAVIILFVTHIKLIVAVVASTAYVPQDDVASLASSYLVNLSHIPYAEKVSVGVFWAVVASIVYVLAVVANNALIEARNEYVIDSEFQNEQGHRSYWLKSSLTRTVWLVLLIGLVLLSITQLLPIWFFWFSEPFVTGNATLWWMPLLSLWALSVNIYAVWVSVGAVRGVSKPEA
jgi:hypothetical protein